MRLLLARILLRLRGPVDVHVWGDDQEYAIIGGDDEVARLHVGRHWVTAWHVWKDDGYQGTGKWILHIDKYPISAVRSMSRTWGR
jgi:hypothetical protein